MSYTNMPDVVLAEATADLDTTATVITLRASRKMLITGLGLVVSDAIAGAPVVQILRGTLNESYTLPIGTHVYYFRFEPRELNPGVSAKVEVKVTTGATASSGDGTVFQLFGRIHPVEDNFSNFDIVDL